MRCPSLEEIFDLLRGRLPEDRAEALRAHVSGCETCVASRGWLEEVLAAADRGMLAEPPAAVLERAFDIVSRTAEKPRPARGWSLSQLVLDTLLQPLPAGVRGVGEAGRRLLYRADDADLDLEVREVPGNGPSFRVTGQILVPGAPPPDDLFAVLWTDGTAIAQTAGDDLGLFVFPLVPPGRYRLEVWVPAEGRGIRIEPLELASRSP